MVKEARTWNTTVMLADTATNTLKPKDRRSMSHVQLLRI